ncbi:MAG: hypothetical protein E2576_11015 [Alcaligenaceae bacterium]|nr:hypothetical protein [Alcaligenaceae bacterium SAGV5]MPS51262.1 hypothetical protein [Alcaligenaceae bacterium SAGV3]MPT57241.1 hypothetical protein [Alcaligenaceae bacterium]
MPKFNGVDITVGGRAFVIPPPSLRTMKQYRAPAAALMHKLATDPAAFTPADGEQLDDLMVDGAYEIVLRNYPELTRAEFEELFDMPAVNAVLAASSGKGGGGPGNDEASQSTSSIGTPSQPVSAISQAGDGQT